MLACRWCPHARSDSACPVQTARIFNTLVPVLPMAIFTLPEQDWIQSVEIPEPGSCADWCWTWADVKRWSYVAPSASPRLLLPLRNC